MSETRLLAVDQSLSKTAWCIFDVNNDLKEFGVIKTSKKDGDLFTRCSMISTGLYEITPTNSILCREGLGFGNSNSNASRDLAYLVGAIERCFDMPFKEVAPTALKKFATGSGKADKMDMVNSLPVEVLNRFSEANYKKSTGLTDLADAYWIGRYFIGN